MKKKVDVSGFEFIECPVCKPKPGSPDLCNSCYNNRYIIDFLKRGIMTENRKDHNVLAVVVSIVLIGLFCFILYGIEKVSFGVNVNGARIIDINESYPVPYEYRHDYETVKRLYDEWTIGNQLPKSRQQEIRKWLYHDLQMPVEVMPDYNLFLKNFVRNCRRDYAWSQKIYEYTGPLPVKEETVYSVPGE